MDERCCSKCRKELLPGGLAYVASVRVFADFDGLLLEPETGINEQLSQVLQQIRQADPEEMEKEVYEEFTFFLCKSCRDRFVDEVRHPRQGLFQVQKGPGKILH